MNIADRDAPPGKNAPDVSLTVPAMLPVAACAQSAVGRKRSPETTKNIDLRRVIGTLRQKMWTRYDQ